MGLYLCICTYICKYVAGGAYMPLAGTSRVQGIKVGFKGVKEEPYWKVLIVTDRHTDTQTFTGVRVKCCKQIERLFKEVRMKSPCMNTLPMCLNPLLLLLSLPIECFKTPLSSLFDHHRASNSSKGTFAPSPV